MTESKRGDVVYTPDWAAADIVDHFQPQGIVLDPCRGAGAFWNLLPLNSPWCEITDGRDFFDWQTPVDWVIGNPPYSITRKWFRHSYTIADQLLYLVPLRNIFSGYGFVREIHEYGGIREIRTYGTGGRLGFPMGNAVGVLHIQRGYRGATQMTFYDPLPSPTCLHPYAGDGIDGCRQISDDWDEGVECGWPVEDHHEHDNLPLAIHTARTTSKETDQ